MAKKIPPAPYWLKTSTSPRKNNPFTDGFWKRCLEWYGLKKTAQSGDAKITLATKIPLRCDDLLNKMFRSNSPAPIPTLTVDGTLWMSLSACEVQAAELNIAIAEGVVWTAGLGLGYFPMRCAAKKSVKEVHVVEQDKDVIKLFMRLHDRPYLDKIKIYHGDARDIIRGKEGDFCWMDTYESILPDQVIADGKYYQKHNNFKQYCFFGWELAMLWCLMGRKIPAYTVPQVVLNYLKTWKNTPIDETGEVTGKLSDLAREAGDYSFSLKAIRHACTLYYR